MNLTVIIAAAGRSSRFGETDKLNQDLGGRPVLMRSVEPFTRRQEVSSIIVAAPPDELESFRERYGPALGFHGARIVAGGHSARWETIRAALAEVPDEATHVAVHDAARPGLSDDLLDRLVEAAAGHPAVIPAVAISGTVKRVTDAATAIATEHEDDHLADAILGEGTRRAVEARTVLETLDRAALVEVQTPQIFQADLLRRAYADDQDMAGATDDAMLVERLGEPVAVIEGDRRNIKITAPGDLPLVRALMGLKPPSQRPVHKRF